MAKSNMKRALVQMQLDFGQKNFGSTVCRGCGMVYVPSVKEDADQHAKFHKKAAGPAGKLSRRKTDKVLEQFFDGSCIISVSPADFLSQPRFGAVRQRLQRELGSDSLAAEGAAGMVVLVALAADTAVTGCCIAEQVESAHRLLVSENGRPGAWQVAEAREKALVGIYRLWVAPQRRGQGVGSALVDCARHHLIYSLAVPKAEVAFSDPTPQGRDFAAKYFGRDDFLVYLMRPKSRTV